jgi:ABC-type oligopeptide transport system ATPase subunit
LVLDEPTASYDLRMVNKLFARMLIMDAGCIVADRPTGELMENRKLLAAHGLEKPKNLQTQTRRDSVLDGNQVYFHAFKKKLFRQQICQHPG